LVNSEKSYLLFGEGKLIGDKEWCCEFNTELGTVLKQTVNPFISLEMKICIFYLWKVVELKNYPARENPSGAFFILLRTMTSVTRFEANDLLVRR